MHALFETSPAGAGTWTAIGAPDTTSPYSASLDTTTLADGDHDLRVTTRDNAGNSTVSATPHRRSGQHRTKPDGLRAESGQPRHR